jgi:hypothetical protein
MGFQFFQSLISVRRAMIFSLGALTSTDLDTLMRGESNNERRNKRMLKAIMPISACFNKRIRYFLG